MTTLIERIDGTRTHLARESYALASRTRRAVEGEANQWRIYMVAQRDLVRSEVTRLTSPRELERAALRLADRTLARAHESVHTRLSRLERELTRASSKSKASAKKTRPSAKRPRTSRRLVNEPTAS